MTDFEIKQARLAEMKNIGMKSAGWMIEVGVDDPEKLAEIGAMETFARMKAAYPRQMSMCGLWALEGALRGVPHKALDAETKHVLKKAYEDLRN